MKKLILLSLLLITAAGVQAASLRQISLEITDEFWQPVTNITKISVFDAGTSSATTIFSDRAGTIEMTNPITTGSTATTFSQSLGQVRWFQRAPDYKVTITDGSKNLTIDDRTGSVTRFPWFDNYIGTAASLSVGDNEEIAVGDQSDMVLAWNNSGDFMSWIPGADGSAFNLGTSGTGKNVDFNVFVDTGLGLKLNEGAATFILDGMTVSINTDSNFATNINTGSSTGAVTIGSSTSGTLALDTDGGMTINADTSIGITATAGTIGLGATGGDITIDGVDSSVIIRGTEAASDAILLDADVGSIDIDSADNITVDAADDIGLTTVDGGITFTAAGGSNGDVTIVSADDTIITSSGKVTITNTEAVTISGALAVTGDTQLLSVTRIDTPIEIVVATNAIEITESGTVYVLNHGTEFATTLPTVASSAGVTFRFIVGADPVGTAFTILTDSLEDKIEGVVVVNGAAVGADGPDDTITFTASAAVVGDWVELTSDGVLWYLSGQAVAATGIVPSKAD